MKHGRLDTLLLAGIGTLTVHEIAYVTRSAALGAVDGEVSHGHLPLLWGLASIIAVVGFGRFVVASLRSRSGSRQVDPTVLGAAIAAFYVSQEATELWATGTPSLSLLTQPVLWLGLAAVPVVAIVLARFVETVVATVSPEPRRITPAVLVPSCGCRPSGPVSPVVALLASVLTRRGPPVRFVN